MVMDSMIPLFAAVHQAGHSRSVKLKGDAPLLAMPLRRELRVYNRIGIAPKEHHGTLNSDTESRILAGINVASSPHIVNNKC
jgi:hypothetical protein